MSGPGGDVVVIGVGNEYRRDDGVGPEVVRRLAGRVPDGVRLRCADGEPTRLLDLWSDARLAILVDAVACEPASPGRLHRMSVTDAASAGRDGASSHGLGIPEAVGLGAALDRLPGRLVVLTVEVADVGQGAGLSAPVAAVVSDVVRRVVDELTGS